MNLDRVDRNSHVWEMLVERVKARLEVLRTVLENGGESEHVEKTRGRIAELRGILLAGEEVPPQDTYNPMHY